MSTPTDDAESPGDAALVEPATASLAGDPLEVRLATALRQDTSVIPVVARDHEPSVALPVESATGATVSEVAPSGWNVLSIVSLVLALVLSPLAALFGYLAVGQIRRSAQRGEAIAWVAVALGWVWALAYVVAGAVLGLTWIQVA